MYCGISRPLPGSRREADALASVADGRIVLQLDLFCAISVTLTRMRFSLALGKREGLTRETAQACVAANLGLPGSGSLMAGRVVGYVQAALTIAAFVLTMVFGLKFIVWCLTHWSSIYGPEADPLETPGRVWREVRWALCGIGCFAFAWLWALITSAGILQQARYNEAKSKPPQPG